MTRLVRVTTRAHCHACEWTATGPGADRAAERHTRTAGRGHATETITTPEETP